MVGILLTNCCWWCRMMGSRDPSRICWTRCQKPKEHRASVLLKQGRQPHPSTQADRLVLSQFPASCGVKRKTCSSNGSCEQWPLPAARRLLSLCGKDHRPLRVQMALSDLVPLKQYLQTNSLLSYLTHVKEFIVRQPCTCQSEFSSPLVGRVEGGFNCPMMATMELEIHIF